MKVGDLCGMACKNPDDYFDTIAVIRGELFVFKGKIFHSYNNFLYWKSLILSSLFA